MQSPRGVPHAPVLLEESVRLLGPPVGAEERRVGAEERREGALIVDCTLGAGGHASALLEAAGPEGRLLGLDCDETALEHSRRTLARFGERATIVRANFRDVGRVVSDSHLGEADVIFFDLGVSSMQLAAATRGFSFSVDGPLDMRMDDRSEISAYDIVNGTDESRLAGILYEFGEERQSRRIAAAICRVRAGRPIRRTGELADIVARTVRGGRQRIHPATRTFQALRIAVNTELESVTTALEQVPALLRPGGRFGVIAFHSLEDRIVKRFILERHKAGTLTRLTKKPVRPSQEEVDGNPRSRSARLRVAEKPLEDV